VSPTQPQRSHLRVVLFSGGRGSGALTEQLVAHPRIALTIAINGYDDGASTGEVRRFLGDSLGPSDFRKNAARLARLFGTRPTELIQLLDLRVDVPGASAPAAAQLEAAVKGAVAPAGGSLEQAARLASALPSPLRDLVADRLARFAQEVAASAAPFPFRDCAIGNVVFAGGFLLAARDFNRAIDDYCALLGLPAGLIENVTDGTNAFLVALDASGKLLRSEEEIVDAKRRNQIADIFLIDQPVADGQRSALVPEGADAKARFLEEHAVAPRLNPRLESAIANADLIVYAPGTQHSSLFPSYLTPGLSGAIARNLSAIKLLVTNIQADAEITGSSAVDIIERATFYLKEKGQRALPTPCLITHYLLNDPRGSGPETPYVPLGRLESLEDPRLVRVANYEEGFSGRHDATKILGPFVESFLARWTATQKVAVLFYEASTVNKLVQSILEMVRAGVRDLPIDLTVLHDAPGEPEVEFVRTLGFAVKRLEGDERARDRTLRELLHRERFDYVVLFESSGMYNGEDVKTLASYLSMGRLDAVWGSRRLSVRDIEESYRLKYRHRAVLGAVSYVGSHVLSLMYLGLYGRYVSDTLSAARAVRAADALQVPVPLTHKQTNQYLLPILLGRKAEMFEVPVQFFSISPEQVRRTSPWDGIRAVATVVAARLRRTRRPEAPAPATLPAGRYASSDAAQTGRPPA
jgi:2-phospho-L-lactate transferase/gluconeogenesis factor (CofD/UPF0052 family)